MKTNWKKFKWPYVSEAHFWLELFRVMDEEEEGEMDKYIFLDLPEKKVGKFEIVREK